MQYNNPMMLAMRRVLRATGLASPLGRLLGGAGGYEQRFHARLTAGIRPGDRVWDIGANIGHYTTIFADLVGEPGRVYAFEPSPANYEKLRAATESLSNVRLFQLALSDRQGTASFEQGADDLGATSQVLVGGAKGGATAIEVAVTTGDALVAERKAAPPTVLKIDVEGHELEVLRGLTPLLAGPEIRELFIEVHFSVLEAQGRPGAPDEIVRMLTAAGYAIDWVDPSHLHAVRARG
jgi:FkbM family methyltransferase